MKTEKVTTQWGLRSVSYWMTLFIALGIIFIGVRFMLVPQISAEAFGIRLSSHSDLAYGRIKGIRDIFSGLALLALLLGRMKRATAYVFTAAIIVPSADCLLVYSHNGLDLPRILVHGFTAVYMALTSILLFKDHTKATT